MIQIIIIFEANADSYSSYGDKLNWTGQFNRTLDFSVCQSRFIVVMATRPLPKTNVLHSWLDITGPQNVCGSSRLSDCSSCIYMFAGLVTYVTAKVIVQINQILHSSRCWRWTCSCLAIFAFANYYRTENQVNPNLSTSNSHQWLKQVPSQQKK